MAENVESDNVEVPEDGIDVSADLEVREAQAKKYLYSIIDNEPPPEEHRAEPEKPAEEKPAEETKETGQAEQDDDEPVKVSLGAYEKRLRKEAKRLEKLAAEVEAKVSIDTKDPIALLRAHGHDPEKFIDKMILGDNGDGSKPSDPQSERIEKLEALVKSLNEKIEGETLQKQRTAAISRIGEELSEESHRWLMIEDNPAELVLQYIDEAQRREPDEDPPTIQEAADKIEKFLAAKAERILKATGKTEEPAKKGRNLRAVGGSVEEKSWEELSVSERERRAKKELQEELRKLR